MISGFVHSQDGRSQSDAQAQVDVVVTAQAKRTTEPPPSLVAQLDLCARLLPRTGAGRARGTLADLFFETPKSIS